MIGARTAERAVHLGGIVTLALCGVLATNAVSHVRAAEPDPVRQSPSLPPNATGSAANLSALSKDGAALAERNPFCHDCAPARRQLETGPSNSGGIPFTELPLELLAISQSDRSASSFVSVRHRDGRQGAYWLGDKLPGAGALTQIGGRAVIFRNAAANRLEKLALVRPSKVTRKDARSTSSAGAGPERQSPIRKDGPSSFVIDRAYVNRVMLNPALLRRPPRVRPWSVAGQVKGLSLYGIGRRSVFSKLGFRNGDRLVAVNGNAATSMDALLTIYGKLKRADHFNASVERRGRPITLSYRIE